MARFEKARLARPHRAHFPIADDTVRALRASDFPKASKARDVSSSDFPESFRPNPPAFPKPPNPDICPQNLYFPASTKRR